MDGHAAIIPASGVHHKGCHAAIVMNKITADRIVWPALPSRYGKLGKRSNGRHAGRAAQRWTPRCAPDDFDGAGSAIFIVCAVCSLSNALGVGYIELGFALTVFAVVSASPRRRWATSVIASAPTDRDGNRRRLCADHAGPAFELCRLIAQRGAAGPCQQRLSSGRLRVLSAHADEARAAFSIHTFAGFSAARSRLPSSRRWCHGRRPWRAPPAGWSAVALLLLAVGIPDASAADRGQMASRRRSRIVTPAIILLTGFMLLSLSTAGSVSVWSR